MQELMAAPDWSVPTANAWQQTRPFFRGWHPGVKVCSLVLTCFVIAGLQSWSGSVSALVVSLLVVAWSGVGWQRPGRRLLVISPFLLLLLVVLPLTAPAHPEASVWLPWWPDLNVWALQQALVLCAKALACALLMEPMLATASLSATMQGLISLGLPASLCQMVLLTHRYIFVFLAEAKQIHRAMRVRGFQARCNLRTMGVMGNFFGMLFLRAFERSERVFAAMRSRGFQGFVAGPRLVIQRRDLYKAGAWLALCVALLLMDNACLFG